MKCLWTKNELEVRLRGIVSRVRHDILKSIKMLSHTTGTIKDVTSRPPQVLKMTKDMLDNEHFLGTVATIMNNET